MPISLSSFVEKLNPSNTILFFGAGSSQPSGAPTASLLKASFSEHFKVHDNDYSLAEMCQIIENKNNSRQDIISHLRCLFSKIKATGGLLSLPMYDWKSIYTTNYDNLIEDVYFRASLEMKVYSSNFDFTADTNPALQKLYKLHGTINKDITDGNVSRIVITSSDYRLTQEYREYLYKRLGSDLSESHMIIIGHSLGDADIKAVIQECVSLKKNCSGSEKITLFSFSADNDRASLYEADGLQVVFGGIDEFFFELAKFKDKMIGPEAPSENFELPITLRPSSIDVEHAAKHFPHNFSRMFNGGAASYSDIEKGFTFNRELSDQIENAFRDNTEKSIAIILGASGVGKTTLCRQVLIKLMRRKDFICWEHKEDFQMLADEWVKVARNLKNQDLRGVLFIDDASDHLMEINKLVEQLTSDDITNFKLLISSGRVGWRPRVKNPNVYRFGLEYNLARLSNQEVDNLLILVDRENEIKRLVERNFAGFSNQERRRRLINRCESDMFVCLKNMFASEKFDDIILKEYAELPDEYREVYKIVSALEASGVRVHRQMVIRMMGIDINNLSNMLYNMTDIINESVVDHKLGVYSWRGRHSVITSIIANYKFGDEHAWEQLFDTVIEQISPTYDIEVKSLRDMCSVEGGISRLSTKQVQNRLLRRMMSVAPGERIPRHRLIRNLIEEHAFDHAETEIRIFENDFGKDGPVTRFKINLTVARATKTLGILLEDRIAILHQAYESALQAIERYPNNVQILSSFCDVGVEHYKLTKEFQIYDEALSALKSAEVEVGDPEISRTISKYERRVAGYHFDE